MKKLIIGLTLCLISIVTGCLPVHVRPTYKEVLKEAIAPNYDKATNPTRPLPLITSWNVRDYNIVEACEYKKAPETVPFSPSWQLGQMEKNGYHFIPTFLLNIYDPTYPDHPDNYEIYMKKPLEKARELNLPIVFISSQWESHLCEDDTYFTLPIDQNPCVCVIDPSTPGKCNINKILSPFGATKAWYDIGYSWGTNERMKKLMDWYPNPPLVTFASNNEANLLTLHTTDDNGNRIEDQRYLNCDSDDCLQKEYAKGFTVRYQEMIKGFKDGLKETANKLQNNATWHDVALFTGYLGPSNFGRREGWQVNDTARYWPSETIDHNFKYFDGGQFAVYNYGGQSRDNTEGGPLFTAMNYPFMIDEAHGINPEFYADIITWHGDPKHRADLPTDEQYFTEYRYKGMVQFAMWMAMPRIVWHFQIQEEALSSQWSWYQSVIDSVENVWNNDTLRSFWRDSTLVVNTVANHPYEYDIPDKYSEVSRMFLLSTSVPPREPCDCDNVTEPCKSDDVKEFNVMALARVRGTTPDRQWLLYAYAPTNSAQSQVREATITIPECNKVTVNVGLEGSFFLIKEDGSVTPITDCSAPAPPILSVDYTNPLKD
jgi:hypothetical protein